MNEISIRAEQLFTIFGFPVTNAVVMSSLVFIVLLVLAFVLRSRLSELPGKLQYFYEVLVEEILDFMETVLGTRELAERYFPLVATIFFFILTSNWLGLLPGVGSIGLKISSGMTVPLLRSPASDLNFTVVLAVIAVFSVNFLSIVALGFKKYVGRFVFPKDPISSFAGLLELISQFVKIISFSFRLFGNVFAGEVLLTIVAFLAPAVLPLPFLFLEVFVGFIQTFIFSMLTLVFVAMAVTEHAHE